MVGYVPLPGDVPANLLIRVLITAGGGGGGGGGGGDRA